MPLVEVEYSPGGKPYCFDAPHTKVGKTLYDPVFRRRVKVVRLEPSWSRNTPRRLERCRGRRSHGPALWGSTNRVQIGSSDDRRKWRFLRARLGRERDRRNYEREYEQQVRSELAYEQERQRGWWQEHSHSYHTVRWQAPTDEEYRRLQRDNWTDLQQVINRQQQQITATYTIPPVQFQAEASEYPAFATTATRINFVNNATTTTLTSPHYEPEPVMASTQVSRQFIQEMDQRPSPDPIWADAGINVRYASVLEDLQRRAEHLWQERYGTLPQDPIWVTWVSQANVATDGNVEVGVMMAHRQTESVRSIWNRWAREGVATTVARGRPRVPTPAEVERAEERAEAQRIEQQRRNEELARQVAERAREQQEAEERAEELLKAHLTEEQMQDWERANRFEVIVGDRRYRVTRGRAGNVYLLDQSGNPVESYCIHSPDSMPDADHCLSQKFLLESNEGEFRRVANITPYRNRRGIGNNAVFAMRG